MIILAALFSVFLFLYIMYAIYNGIIKKNNNIEFSVNEPDSDSGI